MSTTIATHASPRFATVLEQQVRLLWLSWRPLFIIALLAGSELAAAAVMTYHGYDVGTLMMHLGPAVIFAAGAWGILLWRDEGPVRRTYHWSLPYDAAKHDLTRAAAGAVWLFIAIALFMGAGVLVALLSGEGDVIGRTLPLLLPHFFIAGFTAYLLGCALSTYSDRPVEWLLFMYLGVIVVVAVGELAQVPWLTSLVNAVFGKPYGLGWALVAAGAGAEVRMDSPELAEVSLYYTEWLPVALAWLLIAGGVLVLAARARSARR
jgi:hypothetical protein